MVNPYQTLWITVPQEDKLPQVRRGHVALAITHVALEMRNSTIRWLVGGYPRYSSGWSMQKKQAIPR